MSVPATRAYRLVRWLGRVMLHSQYRQVEIEGAEHVPADGPVLIVANHFSAMVDSMALLVASPRPVAFLAKAPLFQSRLLRPFLRGVGAVPVFRPQDAEENAGKGARANLEVFDVVRARLEQDECLAIFPEGVSQPQPRLMPLRTGAARILTDSGAAIHVAPAALVFEHPGRQGRGRLLIRFDEGFKVQGATGFGSRRQAIAQITRRIETSLRSMLPEADSQSELDALRALRMAFDQERGTPRPRTLGESVRRDRRMARWLDELRHTAPDAVSAVRAETDAYLRSLSLAGLSPEMVAWRFTRRDFWRFALTRIPVWLVLGPLGVLACVATWPLRMGGDILALRAYGGREDVRAFCRIAGVGLLLVLGAVVGAAAAAALCGLWPAIAVGLGLPALLWLHVVWRDHARALRGQVRAFLLLAGSPLGKSIRGARTQLYEAVLKAAEQLRLPGAPRS